MKATKGEIWACWHAAVAKGSGLAFRLWSGTGRRPTPTLSCQWIFYFRGRGVDEAAEFRFDRLHFTLHLPRDFAVGEVALHSAAQFGNVLRFGEVHFEQEARARAEGQQVLSARRGKTAHGSECGVHRGFVHFARARLAD